MSTDLPLVVQIHPSSRLLGYVFDVSSSRMSITLQQPLACRLDGRDYRDGEWSWFGAGARIRVPFRTPSDAAKGGDLIPFRWKEQKA